MPTLSVVAGPNGSGKSTLTSSIWSEGNANLIDPDSIARRLDASQPAKAAIPAADSPIALLQSESLSQRSIDLLQTGKCSNDAIDLHVVDRGKVIGHNNRIHQKPRALAGFTADPNNHSTGAANSVHVAGDHGHDSLWQV
jgi:hypothetical protein